MQLKYFCLVKVLGDFSRLKIWVTQILETYPQSLILCGPAVVSLVRVDGGGGGGGPTGVICCQAAGTRSCCPRLDQTCYGGGERTYLHCTCTIQA